ncbi:hypothetical protein GGTG_04040 [Gaeumannomyces tritici R3-111a-1]|uniref:D-isomer specific 2-hydroxyacid dehydrogenase NAD-binding domain-containing protein n=1 Tax=Gaeumannomyces tritici (strain R3-111a-1) TaxID=644352 RepID=J3NRZ2_GAET3|nr:hypothetical protein GGTG_04040 [Gaeumannomyces tritici R3-111a-1]EJT78948.1 hypothetical protein GGTG_04040 [Gaeumannomyces tritici R3-111a-1]
MRAAFGMRVVAWSANLTQDAADARAAEAGLPAEDPSSPGQKTFRVVTREELFATADVLSVHVVLSVRTRGLVGADDLARMKPTALLVNTARGPVVQESALLDALGRGAIRGAALDVFDLEPLPLDSPWRTTEWGRGGRSQVLLTPHMGYVEKQTLDDWYAVQVENIRRWQKGQQDRQRSNRHHPHPRPTEEAQAEQESEREQRDRYLAPEALDVLEVLKAPEAGPGEKRQLCRPSPWADRASW